MAASLPLATLRDAGNQVGVYERFSTNPCRSSWSTWISTTNGMGPIHLHCRQGGLFHLGSSHPARAPFLRGRSPVLLCGCSDAGNDDGRRLSTTPLRGTS